MRFDDQVNSSETFDFIFPDENYLNKNPNACMLVEAQTTINDFDTTGKGEVVKGIQRFLMTNWFRNNSRDKNFLTRAKLDELRDKMELIVHKDVKKFLKRKKIFILLKISLALSIQGKRIFGFKRIVRMKKIRDKIQKGTKSRG